MNLRRLPIYFARPSEVKWQPSSKYFRKLTLSCIWVKILCHAIFVRLDTADRGGSMMGAIMRFFTEKYHLDPVFFI